jgi:hypothetical protein
VLASICVALSLTPFLSAVKFALTSEALAAVLAEKLCGIVTLPAMLSRVLDVIKAAILKQVVFIFILEV